MAAWSILFEIGNVRFWRASRPGWLNAPRPGRTAALDFGGRLPRRVSAFPTGAGAAGRATRYLSGLYSLSNPGRNSGRSGFCAAFLLDGAGAWLGLRALWWVIVDAGGVLRRGSLCHRHYCPQRL